MIRHMEFTAEHRERLRIANYRYNNSEPGVCTRPGCTSPRDVGVARDGGPGREYTRCALHRREVYLRDAHNMSLDRWQRIWTSQGEACALCGTTDPGGRFFFHLDHDHRCCPGARSCGRCARGILCNDCNAAYVFGAEAILARGDPRGVVSERLRAYVEGRAAE